MGVELIPLILGLLPVAAKIIGPLLNGILKMFTGGK